MFTYLKVMQNLIKYKNQQEEFIIYHLSHIMINIFFGFKYLILNMLIFNKYIIKLIRNKIKPRMNIIQRELIRSLIFRKNQIKNMIQVKFLMKTFHNNKQNRISNNNHNNNNNNLNFLVVLIKINKIHFLKEMPKHKINNNKICFNNFRWHFNKACKTCSSLKEFV